MEYNAELQQAIDMVFKTLQSTGAGGLGVTNPTLVREDLSDVVSLLVPRDTPLRNRFKRTQGAGAAHSWTVISSLGQGGGAFQEGQLPTAADSQYDRRSAAYKLLGNLVEVTDLLQASGANFTDVLAMERKNKILKTMLDEERMIINGDSTANAAEFNGLRVQITDNVVNAADNDLTIEMVNEALQAIYERGGSPRCLVLGPREKRIFNNLLLDKVRFLRQDGISESEAVAGISVQKFMSDFGELDIVTSRYITPEAGTARTFALVLDDETTVESGNCIEMVDLVPMSRTPLAKVTSSTKELCWEATVLAMKAPIFQAKITNLAAV